MVSKNWLVIGRRASGSIQNWTAILFFAIFPLILSAQTVISSETFDEPVGSLSGTMSGGEPWSAAGNNCDGTGSFGTTGGGAFQCLDYEGMTCCDCILPVPNPAGTCGDASNEILLGPINIAAWDHISIDVFASQVGDMECVVGGNPNAPCPSTPLSGCNGGNDQMVFSYSVDGGPYTVFQYYCGDNALCYAQNFACNISGNSITIQVLLGTQATGETYLIQDIIVYGYPEPSAQAEANGVPTAITACAGSTVNLTESSAVMNTAWAWTGPGVVNPTMQNTTATLPGSGTAVYTVTTTDQFGCTATSTVTVTVEPPPSIDPIPNITVCAGDDVNIPITGTGSATYNWTNSNTAIGLMSPGSGDIIFTAANVAANQTGTVVITPQGMGCTGPTETFTITVAPLPVVNAVSDKVVCAGANVPVNFSGGPAGTIYSWTNDNTAIGLGASGTGNFNFPSANVSNTEVGTITVVPENAAGCMGTPQTFTITVNPIPVADDPGDQIVCEGQDVQIMLTGTPSPNLAWSNSNTAIGLGSSGNGDIDFTAADVSNPTTGLITIVPSENGCTGATQFFNITVFPLPYADPQADIVACGGQQVEALFTGSPSTNFTWTNDNPNIGLPSSGSGDISYPAPAVSGVEFATITVIPETANCQGDPVIFNITINSGPTVTNPGNKTVCAGAMVNIPLSGTSGASFSWTNSNTNIGLMASGNGSIMFPAANVSTPQTGLITVTPSAGGCTGAAVTFTITVNPIPVVTNPGNQSACPGDTINIPLTGTNNAVLSWLNSNTAIGLMASGTGSIGFTAAATPASGTIIVTPSLNGCTGPSQIFSIDIVTGPVANNPGDQTVCAGDTLNLLFSGSGGATFNWTNSNTAIGLPASGSGPILLVAPAVAVPQTGIISLTPSLGTCSGAAINFNITVNPAANASITGPAAICLGSTASLVASGGADFMWDIGAMSNSVQVGPSTTTTYTVTVTTTGGCSDVASATVVVNQPDAVTLQTTTCNPANAGTVVVTLSNQNGCDSVITTVTTLLPSDTVQLNSFTCNPNATGTFTQLLTNQYGCDSLLITTISFDPNALDTTNVSASTCDLTQTGVTQAMFTGSDGCDSLVITNTVLLPTDTTSLSGATCDPVLAGVFVQTLNNQFGCDSLVLTTIALLPTDTLQIQVVSCDPAAAGVFTQTLSNQFGCDSIVITNVTFDPAAIDTTYLQATTCNPASAGITQTLFNGADGCDSLVITATQLLPSDTTFLATVTCKQSQTGVFTAVYNNIFQCDSTVITTVTFDPSLLDTTYLVATTCNPAMAGVSQVLLAGSDGCDSLVRTTTSLLPTDTTYLSGTTCQSAQAGVFTTHLTNVFLCDSVLITTVSFDPSLLDTTSVVAGSCDPAQTGVTQLLLAGSDGCDSLVITTTTLLPTDTTYLSGSSCDPAQAGVFTNVYTNIFQCDSVVIRTVNLLPSDTTAVSTFTCVPGDAGVFTNVYQNIFQCDSVVVTTVVFDQAFCVLSANASATPVSCPGGANGDFTITVQSGTPPYVYNWAGSSGNSGSGQISGINTPQQQSGLPAGTYTVTVSEAGGGLQSVISAVISQPPPITLQAAVLSDFNGFALRCAGDADGIANAATTGGTTPYNYVWSNNAGGAVASNLAAGSYTVTMTDQNGCTAVSSVLLAAPPLLQMSASTQLPDCGDTLADVVVLPSGGVPPYSISVDGNIVPGMIPSIPAGNHTVEVIDANNCTADSSWQLVIPSAGQITLPQDTSVQMGVPFTLEAFTTLTVWDTLYWQPLSDTAHANSLIQTFMPFGSTVYTLTIVDTFGCITQARVLVSVSREVLLYVPNVFSPNNDGVNDFFQLGAGPGIQNLEFLQIYDRWGELLYDWDQPVPVSDWAGWDGRARGKDVNPGVFVYVLRVSLVDGTTVDLSGDITVIR